ncbi:MAG: 1-phosphofructokinase family hexose kinase [Solirubrobacteraceae bacterium]
MIVCVAGNPSVDRLVEVEALAAGEIHRPTSLVVVPGGKGLHVARVCATLGCAVTATGILAGHAGRWISEALAHDGVPARFAWGPGETRSCLSVADQATGGLTEFYESGTSGTVEAWSDLEAIVAELLSSARWLTLSGSLPRDTPVEGYAELIDRAAGAGVPAAIDSRGPWLAAGLEAGPALVKVNAYEASELLDEPVTDRDRGVAAARTIRDRAGGDGHAVAITLGEAGMVLVDPDGRAFTGSTPARGRYPVGSGDALMAGLVAALADGERWVAAAAAGLGAGAANAEIAGAGRLDPARARELAAIADVAELSE